MTSPATFNVLRDALAKAKAHGHEYVKLVRSTRGGNSPRNWDRCRVVSAKPSLMGRCVGATGRVPGEYLFDVTVLQLEAFLYAHGELPREPTP